MEIFACRHVTFQYPEQERKSLNDISFSVSRGEFVIVCGPSGCGKSTLLRQLKTCLAPHGRLSGEILYKGKILSETDDRTQSGEIGYMLQSPENQVVTDKVWHELAFGLESLGYDTPTIHRRVAELASFFGIETWFYKNVNELSGGQKQILSLASIMTLQTEVLILDEPTAQLDPIAASEFLSLLGKINRELGTTILLTEHRLEEAIPYATRMLVMEQGALICDDRPEQVGMLLKDWGNHMFLAMPAAMRVWAALDTKLACPLTIREGSQFLTERNKEVPLQATEDFRDHVTADMDSEDFVLTGENLWFRYEKEAPDVVKGFQLKLKRGEFFALLGGNGAGKSTTLKLLSGIQKPQRGTVHTRGSIGYLPQNPQSLFVKKTVREELLEMVKGKDERKEEREKLVSGVVKLCSLTDLLNQHPFDLSGGEQQRCALAKVLLLQPDILFLDEPTKGFDAEFKAAFAGILKKLLKQGVTILMVSHDVNFCAEYAHRCGLFFDGNMVANGTPKEFFSGNSFYTTSANRMARHLLPDAVTVEEVIGCCGGSVSTEKETEEKDLEPVCLPIPKESSRDFRPVPLPLWRKMIATGALAIAVLIFFYATSITDLSKMITSGGLTGDGKDQIKLYLVLIVSLFAFLMAIGRRSARPVLEQLPIEKRRLSKRTKAAACLILLCIPLTIFAGVMYLDNRQYYPVAIAVLLECMIPFFLVFEGRKPKARELVVISVLCSITVASRGAFFMLPQFKPVMALTIIAGVAFGGETGFFVGAVSMLVSNMMFSQGPWTPWQMFSMGIIGFLAGVLFQKGWLRRNRASLASFGAVSAVVIYGGIMNFASAVMWSSGSLNRNVLLAYYVSGFPMDLIHACATVIFLTLGAEPMLEKLDRIKVKYGLIE